MSCAKPYDPVIHFESAEIRECCIAAAEADARLLVMVMDG